MSVATRVNNIDAPNPSEGFAPPAGLARRAAIGAASPTSSDRASSVRPAPISRRAAAMRAAGPPAQDSSYFSPVPPRPLGSGKRTLSSTPGMAAVVEKPIKPEHLRMAMNAAISAVDEQDQSDRAVA